MLKKLCLLGAAVGALSSATAFAQAPEVALTRLDCGNGFNDSRRFSDTFAKRAE
jgi:N-acyl homoserine lactone hydrolase